jgi:plastocyanin
MSIRSKFVRGVGIAAALIAAACGDSNNSGNPGGPSGGGGGGGNPPTATNTITITSAGVSPKNITVARGSQVTFVNSDNRPHEMASDPHPSHGSCPEIENGVGFMTAGQTKQTGNLNTARTCGYHDHNRDTDTSLQGTIVIQ